jgi:hypothetical protein
LPTIPLFKPFKFPLLLNHMNSDFNLQRNENICEWQQLAEIGIKWE